MNIAALAEQGMFRMPMADTPILPFYGGAYDRGFVALHPFVTIDGLDPAQCEHGTHIVERSEIPDGVDIVAWADEHRAGERKNMVIDADQVDHAAKIRGRPVGWRQMGEAVGFTDHLALNRALRTHIRALRPEFADPEGAAKLVAHCAQRRIFLPTEGEFQPVMERAMLRFLTAAGLDRIIWADEFDADSAQQICLDDFPSEGRWIEGKATPDFRPRRLFAGDGSLFVCVDWDSFFTLILGSERRLAAGRPETCFEGFRCARETEIFWIFQEPLPLVGTPWAG
ncbi:DUF2711 family protein [Aliihoeflea aestuarii]|uniref:DUF2711 family protein n=1 Tax=Aliihoeflea aestuarii TaxID=453840 RepID=UPI002094E3A1|nr:DUF2711 family protein [Aliihoeflea aestuarii]MCO6392677.1 DUF2711 family protein [Aliihoeflea aestuarii]